MRRSRQALWALLVAGLAATACIVLVWILASRDSAPVQGTPGPGTLEPDRGAGHGRAAARSPADDPPTSGPHRRVAVTRDARELSDDAVLHALELGDVVLAYGAARPPAALRGLQRDVAGPFDAELAAAGQAVVLARRPGLRGVVALAWRREQRASAADDPRLRAFVEAWLGHGAPRAG
jgi:hypothetical protein